MARYHYVALSDPIAGQEAEYERWYQEQHIPDILNVPGFVSAQRFWAVDSGYGEPRKRRHMVIYEIETDNPAAVFEALHSRRGTDRLQMSGSFDTTSLFAQLYRKSGDPISPLRSAHPRGDDH